VNIIAIVILAIMAFRMVNIPLEVFGFVGGALALGFGLGAQNLVNNFISGIILLVEQPIRIGDVIEIDGIRGTVRRIASRYSQVRRFDGVDVLVPNREILERQVINLTLDDPQTRLTVKVGVAYGSPTRVVADAVMSAAREHGLVLKDPAPFVLFEDFADSALVFSLNFWVTLTPTTNSLVIASDLRYMIDRSLRDAGIVISFPQRDVHLDLVGPVQVEMRAHADGASPRQVDTSG
jgi:small-conductance mechanosensitive channel